MLHRSKTAWYRFETLRSKLKRPNGSSRPASINDPNENKREGPGRRTGEG
ncbi:uncharacterized protein LACBIDRAFT_318381 [Laccaria bicolor S238N-H82]|uniref:Predicted protein n=1 Tax=Laccaria bicolor (strain S238N-H82 / ATCC MYA-4686) TaxID=486041 RepID=B0D6L8_LACBS|nr:uncharacterized protein LACBIDRAFT_318381 [Laccaria bicolor S238N-H82]EDR09978.1 predicted protein [Laccaria bicolor S238N-H82]|eukprot:XP_001879363.1 predicted protein [Laccaria bicolor S238N-H82]